MPGDSYAALSPPSFTQTCSRRANIPRQRHQIAAALLLQYAAAHGRQYALR